MTTSGFFSAVPPNQAASNPVPVSRIVEAWQDGVGASSKTKPDSMIVGVSAPSSGAGRTVQAAARRIGVAVMAGSSGAARETRHHRRAAGPGEGRGDAGPRLRVLFRPHDEPRGVTRAGPD